MKYGQAPTDRVSTPLDKPEIWWRFVVIPIEKRGKVTLRRKWIGTAAQSWSAARAQIGGDPKVARDWLCDLPIAPRR